MKLIDQTIITDLESNAWIETQPLFGPEQQIKVIGKIAKSEYYVLKCYVCAEDPELFSNGIFRSTKAKLISGQLPCGCSPSPSWEEHQLQTLCARTCETIGIKFLDTVGEFKGLNSKARLSCSEHGIWESTTLNSLLYNGVGCPKCAYKQRGMLFAKPEQTYINTFKESGYFHPDTIFKKLSDRYKWDGCFWEVACGYCGVKTKANTRSLQKGRRYCPCGSISQRQAYINIVMDLDIPIAIKFGIARDSNERLKGLNRGSIYNIVNHAVYSFPDNISCTLAERMCRESFVCGILPKDEIRSGFTETTYVSNMDNIHKIYVDNGGTRIDSN
jgi:hypothetical protein